MLDALSQTPSDWTSYLQTGGVVGVLALLIAGILRQWIVPGWTYTAMEKDRDYYRQIANQSLLLADRQTTVAEVLTDRLSRSDQEHRDDRMRSDQEHRDERLRARADLLRRDARDEGRQSDA